MPTIPDVRQLRRDIPTGPTIQQPAVGVQGQALSTLGQAISNTGVTIQEVQNRQANFDAAKAEADFITKKAELDSSFENDPEYATIPQRYSQGLNEIKNQIMGGLSNNRARSLFDVQAQQHAASGMSRIRGVAMAKEKDFENGSLDQRLLNLREVGVNGNLDGAVTSAEALLQGAYNTGVISAQQLVQKRDAFKTDTAKGYLTMMPPEQRLDALKQPWANNLPSDVRSELMRTAQEQQVTTQAQLLAEDFHRQGLSIGQMNTRIDALPDPKLRAEARTQVDQMQARYQSQRSQTESMLLDKYLPRVAMGEIQLSDIPRADKLALGSSITTLISAQKNGIENQSPYAKYTDPKVMNDLYRIQAAGNPTDLRDYFNQHAAQLSESDYRMWSKASAGGDLPVEVKSLQTVQQRMQAAMIGAKISPDGPAGSDKTKVLMSQIDQWHRDYQQINRGKFPNDAEIDAKIKDLLMVDPASDHWYTRTKRTYETNPASLTIETIQKSDPTGYKLLKNKYPGESDADLVNRYKTAMGYQ